MNNRPTATGRFAVVTPNFNMGGYLAETIESVLSNLAPGDQYFIVDGGSTDDSAAVIRRYENRLSGWVSEPDRGYADAIAKGFSRSSGEYMCWVNSGDLLLAGALNRARKALGETGAEMIFGDDVYIDETACVLQVTNGHVSNIGAIMLYGSWTPLQDACYWRRSLYERIGGINPDVRYAADFDLFLRMSLHGTCQFVPAVFSAFRRHQGQTSKARASDYKTEREDIRRRTLNAVAPARGPSWPAIYYFWLARLRARLWSRHRQSGRLAGRSVYDLQCMATKEMLAV